MKMSKWFHEKTTLCGDTIEDSEFSYAVMSCEYLIDGVDAGAAICHAINNHDRMVEEIAELKGALMSLIEDVGVIYSPTGRCGCDEKHYTITSGEIDDIKLLLAKLNQ